MSYEPAGDKLLDGLREIIVVRVFVPVECFFEVGAELEKKSRGYCSQGLPSLGPVSGITDIQGGFGACYSDEEQSSLLFGFILVVVSSGAVLLLRR